MGIKTIGIVTPGGDAPGMNAAIRATVRKALSEGLHVFGIRNGFAGLIYGEIEELDWKSVSGIMDLGGTILHTERFENFSDPENLATASEELKRNRIDGLIVIGGDGSLKGGYALHHFAKIGVVGIPASIDNDIYGTDETIGFDTACNTAVEAIKNIKDTATSYERIFVVEVMGKKRGFIALHVGLTVGAEAIIIPEEKFDSERFAQELIKGRKKGMRRAIIVYAEGAGNREEFVRFLRERTGFIVRESILGYIQRGGSPTYRSRLLGSLFGEKSIDVLLKYPEEANMVGIKDNSLTITSLKVVINNEKPINLDLLRVHRDISVFKV